MTIMQPRVVDISHHNKVTDLKATAIAGVWGVIHKASQGQSYRDPDYAARREQARAAGLAGCTTGHYRAQLLASALRYRVSGGWRYGRCHPQVEPPLLAADQAYKAWIAQAEVCARCCRPGARRGGADSEHYLQRQVAGGCCGRFRP